VPPGHDGHHDARARREHSSATEHDHPQQRHDHVDVGGESHGRGHHAADESQHGADAEGDDALLRAAVAAADVDQPAPEKHPTARDGEEGGGGKQGMGEG
jgi:hypothetical protein